MIQNGMSIIFFTLHINDMSIFSDDEVLIASIKEKLSTYFKMKDLRIMKQFLGLDISMDRNGDISISQKHYL